MQNIDVPCYELHCDMCSNEFLKFIDGCHEVGNLMISNDASYIWLYYNNNEENLNNFLKKCEIKNYYCKKIDMPNQIDASTLNPITKWQYDQYMSWLYAKTDNEQ